MRIQIAALFIFLTSASCAQADTPKVVASVKPIHSLVAAIMGDTGSPELLVSGGASPHTFSLKPSHATSLSRADLVFWVGPDLEGFLVGPIANLTKEDASISLMRAEGVTLLDAREGGVWGTHEDHDGHRHGHEEEETDHSLDPHLWLDIDNALALVSSIEKQLSKTYPDLAPSFSENASALRQELQTLDKSLKGQLGPVTDIPYIVFHDAYQYFEERYDLSPAGSVTANPEVRPGAGRVADLKQASNSAVCVFAEPQFEARILQLLTEDEGVHLGYLDPLGSALPAGPDHYAATLRTLADSITDCLSQ
jgi:zinc transport system substrate-binding protein